MGKVQMQCPHCGKKAKIDEKFLSKTLGCPFCKKTFCFGSDKSSPQTRSNQENQRAIYEVNGVSGLLAVYHSYIVLDPKGTRFVSAGARKIPYASITAVEFKEAGQRMSGYLKFTILGSPERSGGGFFSTGFFQAMWDPNAFLFGSIEGSKSLKDVFKKSDGTFNKKMKEIKSYIEQQIERQPQAHKPDSNDNLDRLRRLATLRDDGIITEKEFQEHKNKILNDT